MTYPNFAPTDAPRDFSGMLDLLNREGLRSPNVRAVPSPQFFLQGGLGMPAPTGQQPPPQGGASALNPYEGLSDWVQQTRTMGQDFAPMAPFNSNPLFPSRHIDPNNPGDPNAPPTWAGNHPGIAGMLAGALMGLAGTPGPQGPESVGGGISRAVQGGLAPLMAQRQNLANYAQAQRQQLQAGMGIMEMFEKSRTAQQTADREQRDSQSRRDLQVHQGKYYDAETQAKLNPSIRDTRTPDMKNYQLSVQDPAFGAYLKDTVRPTPSTLQEYAFYTKQESDAGRTPLPFGEYQTRSADAARRSTIEQGALNRAARIDAAQVAAGSRPATAAALRVASFYYRMDDALKSIESKPSPNTPSLEEQIASLGKIGQLKMEHLPNMLQSQAGQLYRQAQRQFTEARLRKDSGAAIRDEEYEQDAKMFFAVPGDTSETLARKREARANALGAIKHEAGRAIDTESGGSSPLVQEATGPNGHQIVSHDGGETWFDKKTNARVQ